MKELVVISEAELKNSITLIQELNKIDGFFHDGASKNSIAYALVEDLRLHLRTGEPITEEMLDNLNVFMGLATGFFQRARSANRQIMADLKQINEDLGGSTQI